MSSINEKTHNQGSDKKLQLAWMFTDHAVFQQQMYVPIWGQAKPGSVVTVELNGQKRQTTASQAGEFRLRLHPMPAGGPYTLSVTSEDETVELADIMLGEVWLAGGQSNMEYPLNATWSPIWDELSLQGQNDSLNRVQMREFLAELSEKNLLRAINVKKFISVASESNHIEKWEIMDAAKVVDLSAVAAWFGRTIREKTGVAVGILSCSWGGTSAEAWTSRAGLLSNPVTAPVVAQCDEAEWEMEVRDNDFIDFITENHLEDPGNQGVTKGWANPDFADSSWQDMQIPGSWIKQGIMGNGVLWARRQITIPENWVGHDLTLHLGHIDKHDITYFNGVEVGRMGKEFETACWNLNRIYHIPASIVTSTQATIAIRAYSMIYDGAIAGDQSFFYLSLDGAPEETAIPLAGTWKATSEVNFSIRVPDPVNYYKYGVNYVCTPSILFDSMLRPLIPYGIRGAIWYQGENNAKTVQSSQDYRSTIATMIKDWRYQWGQGDFPFIQVQLAGFNVPEPGNTWPYLRESQLLSCQDLPEVYMVTAIDIGDPNDIHPYNKKDVGYRLACSALFHVYGDENQVPAGPVPLNATPDRNAVRINFRNARNMYFAGGTPKGFEIAGKNGNFVPADSVVIDGTSLVVSAQAVPEPVSVRYSWSNVPTGNLYNDSTLPATSFRISVP